MSGVLEEPAVTGTSSSHLAVASRGGWSGRAPRALVLSGDSFPITLHGLILAFN